MCKPYRLRRGSSLQFCRRWPPQLAVNMLADHSENLVPLNRGQVSALSIWFIVLAIFQRILEAELREPDSIRSYEDQLRIHA